MVAYRWLSLSQVSHDPLPLTPSQYFPYEITADPLNHVVVAVEGTEPYAQLAVYTADAEGKLTTDSTYENMLLLPMFYLEGPMDMKMSPFRQAACGLPNSGAAGLPLQW